MPEILVLQTTPDTKALPSRHPIWPVIGFLLSALCSANAGASPAVPGNTDDLSAIECTASGKINQAWASSLIDDRFSLLEEALAVPPVSPVDSRKGDLIINVTDRQDAPDIKVVVRKPRKADPLYQISDIPTSPEAAYEYLRAALKEAAEKGASTVRFPQNAVIKLKNPKPGGAHLQIRGFEDTVIDFNGSTLTFMDAAPGIVVRDSQRIQLTHGTLRSDRLLASVAQVESDAGSATGLRLTLLPEYATAALDSVSTGQAEPKIVTIGQAEKSAVGWNIRAKGYTDVFSNRGVKTDNYAFHSAVTQNGNAAWFTATSASALNPYPFVEGDYVYLLHENNGGTGILLRNADADVEDVTIDNMTLRNIPGMGIFGEVNRGLHLDHVTIERDPENPLSIWGSSSDAVHINNNGGDIVVENSVFGGSADDLLTAKGNWWQVLEIDRTQGWIVAGNADRNYGVHLWARPGNRLVAINQQLELIGTTTHEQQAEKINSKQHKLYLTDIPEALEIGSLVANPDLAGGRMVVRNNQFSNTRAQGVLVQTSHVLIENNHFENIAGPAVKINFALQDWFEGVTVSDITVENNTFVRTGVGAQKPPHSIYINQTDFQMQPIRLLKAIHLKNNAYSDTSRFDSCDHRTLEEQRMNSIK